MGMCAAAVASNLAQHFQFDRPDILLLLGDRWEMLAAAMVATLASVPIVHICGGDLSGSVDDSIRHAITKLAHVHCVATPGARDRLLRMGESDRRVHIVGAPGLTDLHKLIEDTHDDLLSTLGINPDEPFALVLYHPVVQDAELAGDQMRQVLEAVQQEGLQILCLMPNADSGNSRIRSEIDAAATANKKVKPLVHLDRRSYIFVLSKVELLVGNSSSGIVEAASLGTPVVNIGDRQSNRERNSNTFDALPEKSDIVEKIRLARNFDRTIRTNIYGDGRAAQKISAVISELEINSGLLKKVMTY